jgi:hypothetical protein
MLHSHEAASVETTVTHRNLSTTRAGRLWRCMFPSSSRSSRSYDMSSISYLVAAPEQGSEKGPARAKGVLIARTVRRRTEAGGCG